MATESPIQFHMPTRVHYQAESFSQMAQAIKPWGSRIVLLVVRNEIPDESLIYDIRATLEKDFSTIIMYDDIETNPDSNELDTAANYIRQTDSQVVIGIGGIESISAAKALAMMITNDGFCSEFLSNERKPGHNPIHCVTMPLYPCYGMEIVPSFILTDAEDRKKKIFYDERLFPTLTYIDPSFSLGLARDQSCTTGIAIVAAAVETLLSRRSNEITNSMALRAIEMVFRSLPKLVDDPKNISHRNAISMSSLLVGMAYANGSLGTCQAIAMATNGITGLSEDLIMGVLLPHVMEYNLTTSATEYVQIARLVDDSNVKDITRIEAAIKAVEGVRKLYVNIHQPMRLSEIGLKKSDYPEIAALAAEYSFLKNTPRTLNRDEIESILIAAF